MKLNFLVLDNRKTTSRMSISEELSTLEQPTLKHDYMKSVPTHFIDGPWDLFTVSLKAETTWSWIQDFMTPNLRPGFFDFCPTL